MNPAIEPDFNLFADCQVHAQYVKKIFLLEQQDFSSSIMLSALPGRHEHDLLENMGISMNLSVSDQI